MFFHRPNLAFDSKEQISDHIPSPRCVRQKQPKIKLSRVKGDAKSNGESLNKMIGGGPLHGMHPKVRLAFILLCRLPTFCGNTKTGSFY